MPGGGTGLVGIMKIIDTKWEFSLLLLAMMSIFVAFAGTAIADEIKEVEEVPQGTFKIQVGNNANLVSSIGSISGGDSLCSDIDLIFILDRSGTMSIKDATLPSGANVTRLEAVKFSTKNLIDLLPQGTNTRVGIVSYTNYGLAKIDQSLTSDFALAKNAVDSIQIGDMTAIGEGIKKAIDELQANGNNNKRIFVLLTDGLANENPPGWIPPSNWTPPAGTWNTAEKYALYEAYVARTFSSINPTNIYTIGVGYNTSLNVNLLRAIATKSGGNYFYAGTTSIEAMFDEIGATTCAGIIDVLILANFQRMKDLKYDSNSVDLLEAKLQNLATNNPNGRGILVDLNTISSIQTNYTNWNGNEGDIIKTNNLVQSIDDHIENLKKNTYPHLKYVILAGSHEVLPMKARPDDYTFGGPYSERHWAESLPQTSGYLYDIYHAGTDGYYLTDTKYADLSYLDTSIDHELTPELAVGRLVETPEQIIGVIDAYMKNQGIIPKENYVSIASKDYLDGGTKAKNDMVASGAATDSSLIQCNYLSSSVPPLLNRKHDVVYFAGHGNYNVISTGNGSFMAGNSASQGDTSELNPIDGATIITSGCHNGVNFGNKKYHAPDAGTTYSEFPEEFSKKNVVAYVGATGYTAITPTICNAAGTIGYSEALATNIVTNMVQGQNIGQAFVKGANDYFVSGTVSDVKRRVLAIPTLYGIPTYEPVTMGPVPGGSQISGNEPITGYKVQEIKSGNLQSVSDQIIISVTDYSITSGLVMIPGAAQDVSLNEPMIPVLFIEKTLPLKAKVSSIKWNETTSTNVVVSNDIPIAGVANDEVVIDGQFSYDGFYPVTPNAQYSILTLGGGGSKVGVAVNPVQYNSNTHQTKIWTKMVFDIEYDIPDTGFSVSGLSTDKNMYSPGEIVKSTISISNKGDAQVVDLDMIMRDADTSKEITTVKIGQMGTNSNTITTGTYSVDITNIPQIKGKTIIGELIVSYPIDDTILASENVIFSVSGLNGDLNGNGIPADAGDLVLMKRASIGEILEDSRYDLNNNGQYADAGDLVLMKRASIGEINLWGGII